VIILLKRLKNHSKNMKGQKKENVKNKNILSGLKTGSKTE
jgi:hypothetical protein